MKLGRVAEERGQCRLSRERKQALIKHDKNKLKRESIRFKKHTNTFFNKYDKKEMLPLFSWKLGTREMKAHSLPLPSWEMASCEFQQVVYYMDPQKFLGTRANLPIVQKVNKQSN